MTQSRDISNFRQTLSRQDSPSWAHSPASSTASTSGAGPSSGAPLTKKSRPKSNIVYSQPVDTHHGMHSNTQLVNAINHLKSKHHPMRIQDVAVTLNIPLDTDETLLDRFRSHERIFWDRKTDLYSYRHDFVIHSKLELLTSIRRSSVEGKGVSVRVLKDSWKDAPTVVEELENEKEVLVIRTTKDGQPKMVFWNEIQKEEEGGFPVETEFSELWHSLKTPNEPDLLNALTSFRLSATAAAQVAPKQLPGGKKKGKKSGTRQRATKITNTHLRMEMEQMEGLKS